MTQLLFSLLVVTIGQTNETATFQIALSVQQEGRSGIYVLSADGNDPKQLTNNRNDILPSWSPDGKQIAFLSLRPQDHELAVEQDLAGHWFLYVMNADGQDQRRVTKTPIGAIFHWSSDGSRFLFQSSYEDPSNKGKDGTVSSAIYTISANGSRQTRLTPIQGIDSFPAWSPDGKRIAFCSNRAGAMDIFVMNADGSGTSRVTADAAADTNPIWSPDGNRIAFTSYRRQGDGSVYVVGADGRGERWICDAGSPAAWSPDGNRILVASDGQITVIGTDGQHQRRLTRPNGRALDGVFSPDGKKVYFRWNEQRDWKIVAVGVEGQGWQHVTDLSSGLGFSLSPINSPSQP